MQKRREFGAVWILTAILGWEERGRRCISVLSLFLQVLAGWPPVRNAEAVVGGWIRWPPDAHLPMPTFCHPNLNCFLFGLWLSNPCLLCKPRNCTHSHKKVSEGEERRAIWAYNKQKALHSPLTVLWMFVSRKKRWKKVNSLVRGGIHPFLVFPNAW